MSEDERQEVSQQEFDIIKAVLGQDAEAFRRTHLGRYVFDRIQMEEEQLIEDLIEAALVCGETKVVNIALDIIMHRKLPLFIDEAMQAGRTAEHNIHQAEAQKREY